MNNDQRRKKWEENRRKGLTHGQIMGFYSQQLGGLRKMVSLSRKGKPRKQPWGMHIEK